MERKHVITLVIVAAVAVAIWFFFFRKKSGGNSNRPRIARPAGYAKGGGTTQAGVASIEPDRQPVT